MDIKSIVDPCDIQDEIMDDSDKSNATRTATYECPQSIPIPAFVYPPTLDRTNAPAMPTASQTGYLNSYPVPPSTPTTPNTIQCDVLAEVATERLPDSPPTIQKASNGSSSTVEEPCSSISRNGMEDVVRDNLQETSIDVRAQFSFENNPHSSAKDKDASNAIFNTVEEQVSPHTRISTEKEGDMLLESEAASILGGIKQVEEERAKADSLTKNTVVLSDISCSIGKPLPPDLEAKYIERVGTLFESAHQILENLDRARKDPHFKYKVLMHSWMEQSIEMEIDKIPEADQESRFTLRCKMEADLLRPEQLSGIGVANSPSYSLSPLDCPSESAPSSSNNPDIDNTRRQLTEKLRNQQLRSGMRIAKSTADLLSHSDNLNLPLEDNASSAFPMDLDKTEFAGCEQNLENDSTTQSSSTNDGYDTDATITDPDYRSHSDTDMEGVDKGKGQRGRPSGASPKKVDDRQAQKPANGKTKSKGKSVGRTNYASQPIYNGPPAYFTDLNRTDIYANTANSYRDENGMFRWIGEEDEVPFTRIQTATAKKGRNIAEHKYSLPPVTPHLSLSAGMMVEPTLMPLKPTPIEPEVTLFTPCHPGPRAPKIKLTMSQSLRTSIKHADRLNEQGMFPSTDGCYDPYALPRFGITIASKESSMRSTARNTVSKDLNIDDPMLGINTANFSPSRKRHRSLSPNQDDPPLPLYDNMTLPLKKQRYVRNTSGKYTNQTPQEYEDGKAELKRRREERKRKDDAEMYQGLLNFNGSQKGWNGEPEDQREITLQMEQQARDRKLQAEIDRENAAAKPKQSTTHPRAKKEKVDAKMLEDSFLALQNEAAIAQIALDDEVEDKLEELHAMMRSRNVDMDAIKREALQAARERKANNGRAVSRSPPRFRSPNTPGTPTHTKSKSKSSSNSPTNGKRSSSEEERLKGHNLGKAFDPPTTEKRVVKKRLAFGAQNQEQWVPYN